MFIQDISPIHSVPISLHAAGPTSRLRDRVALASGERAAQVLTPCPITSPKAAIGAACTTAALSGLMVSVPAGGRITALPRIVERALDECGLEPSMLELSVSGPLIARAGVEALLALSALRDNGVGIALSGYGATSMDLLQRTPLSAVILSPGLLRSVALGPCTGALLQTLVSRAQDCGLGVVARGIETEGQRALLAGLGCAQGEGGLFESAEPQSGLRH